jgi:hypothetical protein
MLMGRRLVHESDVVVVDGDETDYVYEAHKLKVDEREVAELNILVFCFIDNSINSGLLLHPLLHLVDDASVQVTLHDMDVAVHV